ncbi:putative small g protein signaling modulator 3 [Phaeomoniella chlamydospora]|uniref:Putative small g protein signaling modulator 3 n=1 Tax=Phaeomoniella chlamydospora TaxID=158046 RepID=A0A0G2DRR9_PHACM|nr:putative small g protein signaling modulator 3 [Phaeomoniella chlamydospora]
MANDKAHSLRRSSSQASDVSSHSGKIRTVRVRPKKSLTNTNATTPTHQKDPSLTSFPSLSPEAAAKSPPTSTDVLPQAQPQRSGSQLVRDRKATLAGLTNASPSVQGRGSLFDDSPRSSIDIPGALHLATDEHIERLIAKSGAVKLVRQFAQDLAQRDAELSALRIRADDRERELKKMLREVEVSSLDIERRLRDLDTSSINYSADPEDMAANRPVVRRKITTSIDDMMHQAMEEGVGLNNSGHRDSKGDMDVAATIRPAKPDHDDTSSITSRKRTGSIRSWQDYIWGSGRTSRKTSRSSSMISEDVAEDHDATAKVRAGSASTARRKGLENLFALQQQSSGSSYFIGGTTKPVKKAQQADNLSIASKKSERSISSWTVKLFAGNPQSSKDNNENNNRARSSSLDQPGTGSAWKTAGGSSSALAALAKMNSQRGNASVSSSRSSMTAKAAAPPPKRGYPSSGSLSASPDTAPVDMSAANLGPVEMDAILPDDTKPPTMNNTYTYNNFTPRDMLTDRFGFIYDQRQRKRQREAQLAVKQAHRKSGTDSLERLDAETDRTKSHERKASNSLLSSWVRPSTPVSIEGDQNEAPSRSWQDYLRISTRPTELLSHTPSAGAIVTLTVADSTTGPTAELSRTSPISVDTTRGSLSAAHQLAEPTESPVVADTPEFSCRKGTPEVSITPAQAGDQEPVKLLLEQLTELHDKLQVERAVKWNEFLRKVRAERGAAAAAATDRQNSKRKTANMPEASLLDGEVVGVNDLGNKGKIGRAKWKEFKILVLGGIPVELRPKIWSECSGASALRIPGYYEDLVAASSGAEQSQDDTEVASQIQADIYRTLTDNVFFRYGPGTTKLREVLLAYARRNPTVGYCQGMNMIVGSLLLIMPTAEDAFWILVAMIENILPAHYYDHGLVASRADQIVLREYVSEVLPRLSSHLEDLSVELEAMTFQWFLSVFTDCLSAEALYRVWDVVLCLNSTNSASPNSPGITVTTATPPNSDPSATTPLTTGLNTISSTTLDSSTSTDGTGSTFLFQLALALLKLNEPQLLACDNPASLYGYINHNMTNHAISIDGLIQASEGLRKVVRREDVLEKRKKAVDGMAVARR